MVVGVVERVTYASEDGRFTVFVLRPENGGPEVTAVARQQVRAGERLRLTGRWKHHPRFGAQLDCLHVVSLAPNSREGLIRFLGGGLIRGVGPKTAERLVDHFGQDILRVIEDEPGRLREVEGIGARKAEQIAEGYREHRQMRDLMMFLQDKGVGPGLAGRIWRVFGHDALAVVQRTPYRLAEEVWGIGFATADRIAREVGIARDDPGRLQAGVLYVLMQGAEEGHTCLPEDRLVERSVRLLTSPPDAVRGAMADLIARRRVYGSVVTGERDGVYYSPAVYYHAERGAAQRLTAMTLWSATEAGPLGPKETWPSADKEDDTSPGPEGCRTASSDSADLPAPFDSPEGGREVILTPEQLEAVRAAAEAPLVVITGGPGTGKTTVLREILRRLEEQGRKVELAAPTGRAAKRLDESTERPAKTLHRLLEAGHVEGRGLRFQRHESRPIEADAVVVDECSMMDTLLLYALLRALAPGTRLILVGDAHQLPSVGPGQVLEDIIASGLARVVRLTRVFRQASESGIVRNAYRILEGQLPELRSPEGDWFWLERRDPEALAREVVSLYVRRLPIFLGGDGEIQVLTPMRRGPLGVEGLNPRLQGEVNPPGSDKPEVQAGGRVFRLGDRVMQVRNDYQKEVFNGDVGRVVEIDPEERDMTVEYPDPAGPRRVLYRDGEWDDLQLAYALSVHKSQGSEYDAVVIPVVPAHTVVLERALLYTAVTRAKRLVVLLGDRRALQRAIARVRGHSRSTLLAARLRGEVEDLIPGG
ncbi:SF1B family DNA helicase RecD2 [Kyrpidia tusciae]|uniref:ATP-dependent RecD2 DNA helicase n=1 Tax=Kyrpidia tusciae (strain DSM 2912 / NBRC 15312 / T2) TaxID=562970 RepID=D5WVT4_KYRT2|nr:AAA family ATPase [Kyrpidia tusciae]ADG07627.1 helicase, RecD/TraA family [Kyrpidia tusciae DSM 2912]